MACLREFITSIAEEQPQSFMGWDRTQDHKDSAVLGDVNSKGFSRIFRAGPSTAIGAQGAPNSAQDDSIGKAGPSLRSG